MDLLLALGLILILGLAGALVSRRLSLPTITGYVVMGLILGPTVSGVIKADAVVALDTITAISLGVIAYLIGTSLRIDTVRSLGKSIASITILEAVTAFLAVVAVLAFVTGYFIPGLTLRESYVPFALVMGAAACATAPAAVLAIVREYRAKGPLTTTLLAVVALDDAVAVILFAVAMAVGGALVGNSHALSALDVALTPVLHISGAIGVGAGFAFMVGLFSRLVRTRELTLVLVLGAVILSYGVCNVIGVSGIMANMTFGFVIGNRRRFEQMVVALEDVEPVLYAMFFVLAGLHFDAAVFAAAGPLALIIVVVRCVGKYIGTRVGAWVGGAERQVGAYLGMALLPQAGVSIGLTLIGAASFPELAAPMVSVTLASVIINELITPPLLRSALVKAGEARIDPSKSDSGGQAAVEAAAAEGEAPQGHGSAHEHDISAWKPANGTGASHLLEGPWIRSQRARDRASRDRRA
jgi:Kef-type K+ transport system membrane component KefB